jgi:hypothetical protein
LTSLRRGVYLYWNRQLKRKTTMPLECEDYIGLFDSEEDELPEMSLVKVENGTAGTPLSVIDGEEWHDDPVSVKLEKIRGVFLNAKTAREVKVAAATMPIGDWLEFVGKISKQTDTAPVQITAIRIELPAREDYSGDVVEVELAQ